MTQVAMRGEPYLFRSYAPSEINLIKSSWSKSYYEGTGFKKIINTDEFNVLHRPIMQRILNRPNIAIIVCAGKSDPVILAWIILETNLKASQNPVIHYLYVKDLYKHEGLSTQLIAKAIPANQMPVFYTHRTEKADRILKNHKHKVLDHKFEFNPNLIAEELN